MGSGKVHMQDFHFTQQMCTSSPELLLNCATGMHIPKAILTCRKAGQKTEQQKFLVLTFTDLLISSYQTGGTDGGTGLPVDAGVVFALGVPLRGQRALFRRHPGWGGSPRGPNSLPWRALQRGCCGQFYIRSSLLHFCWVAEPGHLVARQTTSL